jgi:hypothetical protein
MIGMKKLFTLLGLCTLFLAANTAVAQEIKVTGPASVVELKTVAVRGFDEGINNRNRAGVAFPILNFRNMEEVNSPTFMTVDFWALTDMEDARYPYLGAGVSVPVYSARNFGLGLTAGWSANFSDFQNITDRQWSAGVNLTIRF